MTYFLTYKTNEGKEVCLKFYNIDVLLTEIQHIKAVTGEWPKDFCIYGGRCLSDGTV